MLRPRRPTDQERQELIDFVESELVFDAWDYEGIEDISVSEDVAQASIAVFDHFVSTEDEYTGKVMVVVWKKGPECYEVFSWPDGLLTPMSQDIRFAA